MHEKLRIGHLETVVRKQAGTAIIIITQVDPDALGSAFGMMKIFEKLNKRARIYYSGHIAHPQNRAIVNRCNLMAKMKHLNELKPEDLATNFCVLVDSSSVQDVRLSELKGKINPAVVIDHHRDSDIVFSEDNYLLIEDVGACCSLIVEMMQAMEIELTEDDKLLASILALGIYTDTKSLADCDKRDIEAYAYITQLTSRADLVELIDYPLPTTFYKNLRSALERSIQQAGRVVTNIGYVTPNESDDLSTIADLLVRSDSASLVVVWGIIGDKVRLSARNTDISVPLGQFLRDRFGNKVGAKLTPDGRGEGGGIIELDLGLWLGETNRETIVEMVGRRVIELVFCDK